jgi:hypothetical protein
MNTPQYTEQSDIEMPKMFSEYLGITFANLLQVQMVRNITGETRQVSAYGTML